TVNNVVINKTPAIKTWRRFGFVSSRVALGRCCAGNTLVGAVPRLIAASVVCGRMLVSTSVAADAEPSCAVLASLSSNEESLTSAVPSTRQNTSASSFSTRLHWGHRFISVAQAASLRLFAPDNCRFPIELIALRKINLAHA